MCVWTKKRGSLNAVVLMATPCPKSPLNKCSLSLSLSHCMAKGTSGSRVTFTFFFCSPLLLRELANEKDLPTLKTESTVWDRCGKQWLTGGRWPPHVEWSARSRRQLDRSGVAASIRLCLYCIQACDRERLFKRDTDRDKVGI